MRFLKLIFISLIVAILLPSFCLGDYIFKDGKNVEIFFTEKEICDYLQQKGYHKKFISIYTKGKDVIYSIEGYKEKQNKYFKNLINSIGINYYGEERGLWFNISNTKDKIRKLKEAISHNPEKWRPGFESYLYYLIGHLYFNLNDYKNAVFYLNKQYPSNINENYHMDVSIN